MAKVDLESRGQSLEQEFFRKEQSKQLERMREQRERAETIAALRQACGVDDERVLGALADLDVSVASLAAFSLVPLAQVAWADGKLQTAERQAILDAAREKGIDEHHGLLASLLEARPKAALMTTWEAFVHALREEADDDVFSRLAGDVAKRAREVAQAAGGILGLATVSREEQAVLERIETALR